MIAGGVRRQFKKIREPVEAERFGIEPRARYAPQLQFCPGDESRQAESAEAGNKPVRVFCFRADDATAVAALQFEGNDMATETARDMVVLAMDVIGDRAADGDEAGTGNDRQEPAA